MFSALMVGASGSPAPPPKGAVIDIFNIYGWRSRISDIGS
jgi:hypothetical protein